MLGQRQQQLLARRAHLRRGEIRGDTDDRQAWCASSHRTSTLADHVAAGHETIGERFRHDGHRLGARTIIGSESASAHERNAQRLQIVVADARHLDGNRLGAVFAST